jgi:hypothetical protein
VSRDPSLQTLSVQIAEKSLWRALFSVAKGGSSTVALATFAKEQVADAKLQIYVPLRDDVQNQQLREKTGAVIREIVDEDVNNNGKVRYL